MQVYVMRIGIIERLYFLWIYFFVQPESFQLPCDIILHNA